MTPRHPVKRTALLASACLFAFAAQAQPDLRRGERDTAEVQRQFWRCDHADTRVLLDFETAARCSRVTEEFRKLRFGDDHHAFLAWKRAHKAAEHAALAAVPLYVMVEGCVLDRHYIPTTGTPVRALAADGRLLGNSISDGQGRFTLRLPANSAVMLQIDRPTGEQGESLPMRVGAQPTKWERCLLDEQA